MLINSADLGSNPTEKNTTPPCNDNPTLCSGTSTRNGVFGGKVASIRGMGGKGTACRAEGWAWWFFIPFSLAQIRSPSQFLDHILQMAGANDGRSFHAQNACGQPQWLTSGIARIFFLCRAKSTFGTNRHHGST